MSTKRLEAHVRFVPGVAILDLRGEMNTLGEEVLNAAYDEAEGQAPDAILLNFSQVPYINSTGLALIVGLLARARQVHRSLLVCGLSDHFLEIFEITRLVDFMQVFPDEASALTDQPASPKA